MSASCMSGFVIGIDCDQDGSPEGNLLSHGLSFGAFLGRTELDCDQRAIHLVTENVSPDVLVEKVLGHLRENGRI